MPSATALAARGIGLGIEVEDDRAPAQRPQADGLAVLVGELTCVQIKQGFIFTYWKNVHCERRIRSGAATGFVELEFDSECRGGYS